MHKFNNHQKDAFDAAQKRWKTAQINKWVLVPLTGICAVAATIILKKHGINTISNDILLFIVYMSFGIYCLNEHKNAFIDLEKTKGVSVLEADNNYERKFRPDNHFDNNYYYFD
jgi:hypothetical protein